MLRVIACDDDAYIAEWFRLALQEFAQERRVEFELKTFSNGSEMASVIDEGYRPDIIFLDILFPDGNGIVLAKKILDKITSCRLVLMTSTEEFALEGYAVHAYDYLLKPLNKEAVFKLLGDAVRYSDERITIRVKKSPVEIAKSDLCYIESNKHTLIFHTIKKDFVIYGKLDEYEEQLKADSSFIRCHQSYLINMNFTEDIKNNYFMMKNGLAIPMRKRDAADFKRAYYTFIMG